MAKHNYKQESVSGISTGIQSSKASLEGTPLAIETMPYSWNTGLINIVIQWFEVMSILGKRDELIRFFDKGDQRLGLLSKFVDRLDSQATTNLDNQLTSLQTLISDIGHLTSEFATMATVTESHVWIPEQEAIIYNVSDYVGFDSDKSTYFIKDKGKIKDLINQENPDATTLAKIAKVFTLTVNENGDVNTDMLQQLLDCSYQKSIESETYPAMHSVVYTGAYGAPERIDVVTTPIKYAVYKKSEALATLGAVLQDAKYGNLQRILIGAPERLESKHFDTYDNVLNFSDITFTIEKDNMQNHDGYINDLDYFVIHYEASNNDTAKKSTYPVINGSYLCFDHIDNQVAYKDVFYFLSDYSLNNLQDEIKEYLEKGKLEDLNFAVESGKIAWETIKFTLSVVPDVTFCEVAGIVFDSADFIEAFVEYETFDDRQKQIDAYNAEIDETVYKMCGDYTSTIKYSYSYLLLNGYSSSDIIVNMNEYGLITNIDVSHNAVPNPNFSFYDEWSKFLAYCKSNNPAIYEKYKDIVVTDFDSLRDIEDGEVVQRNMSYYYYTHNGL